MKNSAYSKLTILPDANINAVVFGSLILIITAAKRCKRTMNLIYECNRFICNRKKYFLVIIG